ncbi:MAG: rod shape-determining protein MreD [Bacteroidetes bacterium]|nr:MAG: rod shape-determining protein MreD [Bacteroidota bacterium]
MSNPILRNSFRFLVLVLLQIFVFNRIYLGGYLNPYVYLMFILLLPFETPWWLLLISSFSIGLSVDTLSGSLGIHAAAATLAAFVRPLVIKLMFPKLDRTSHVVPGINFMGIPAFAVYVFIVVFIHHFFLFFLEVFRFSEIVPVLFRIGLSSLLSSALIILLEIIFKSYRKGV